ncbi:MAG: putative PEP-binding protein [Sphingomonas sp.]
MAERRLPGLPASAGFATGRIHLVRAAAQAAGAPRVGLAEAIAATVAQLELLQQGQGRLAAEIVAFQIELLGDDALTADAFAEIARGADPATAFAAAVDRHLALYLDAESELFRARAADVRDLRARVLANLAGAPPGADAIAPGSILVCEELTPSGFLERDWSLLAGAATTGGSPASHVATLARARGVPLVVALDGEIAALDGRAAALDGAEGALVIDPSRETIARHAALAGAHARNGDGAADAPGPAVTRAGRSIAIRANVDSVAALDSIPRDWFDGIGLARTELLLGRQGGLVGEDEEVAIYRRLFGWAGGAPVTIRLLDAGGDKPIAGVTRAGEANPFLGVRGVRLLLRRPELLRRQLRAILAAADARAVRILVPMVTIAEEFAAVRALLGEAVAAAPGARAALGAMVETPALALTADTLDADFLSIGTNDLVQYVMAAARDEGALAALHRADHPAVLELVARIAAAGARAGREVSLCGDAAADPALLPRLVAAGVHAFSVPPAAVGAVKAAIRRIDADVGGVR